jgi:hypothetical protein
MTLFLFPVSLASLLLVLLLLCCCLPFGESERKEEAS